MQIFSYILPFHHTWNVFLLLKFELNSYSVFQFSDSELFQRSFTQQLKPPESEPETGCYGVCVCVMVVGKIH